MTLSIWRYAHLALALISSLFLVMASVTGAILAIDAIQEKMPSYRAANFNEITVAQTVPVLKKNFSEISELDIDHNGFVRLKGFDEEGNEVDAYVDPATGKILGKPIDKSAFVEWTTALHRSMFLKETGRLIVGIVSFLLLLIAISGMALIIQRQRSLAKFFTKVVKEYFAQYYHIITGRLILIPVLVIALTGTYLCMARFQLFPEHKAEHKEIVAPTQDPIQQKIEEFELFKNTKLADVKKIEFPFAEDPEEYYNLKLSDTELIVDQFSGNVLSEVKYPTTLVLENLSLDLHTGRTNIIWAVILGIACLNILFFIYSGFAITLKRRATKIKNKHKTNDAEFILLVGTENGSTLRFANAIHEQLIAQGKVSYLAQLNQYQVFPKAKHLLVFTSTYGLGDPPSNANKVWQLIDKFPQKEEVNFSVIGFGSHSYPDFCEFAKQIDQKLAEQAWAKQLIKLHTIDDKSAIQFVQWVKTWSEKVAVELATTPALYAKKPKGLHKMMVLDRTEVSEAEQTFTLTIRTPTRTKFTSGDLLAIYPADDNRERLYSVAKCQGNVQLVVKLHPSGLGSSYLNDLKVGDTFRARMVTNESFHQPKNKPLAMIANGTGIAPFLGMITQSNKNADNHLYVGFRKETDIIKQHKAFLDQQIQNHKLKTYQFAFSREQNHCYVMDLIRNDASYLALLLNNGGVVMICGSLQMQQDVEKVIDEICMKINGNDLAYYKKNGQLLTDCY
ncbi:PepSY domain-containing protein [Pedobacter chitinilyticus]|uniref:NADPH--hemoprotein reductase n=1 Tax=Pedobacter chitinilyticus TaxID=2233776 RepID=A0A451GDP4_9SPHI|nr:PepSY domain-containing protein [Pedobacter chitinilyticus]RWU11013.1 FAD-binding oxidoreductase [Pedobacter chitinilyticus]